MGGLPLCGDSGPRADAGEADWACYLQWSPGSVEIRPWGPAQRPVAVTVGGGVDRHRRCGQVGVGRMEGLVSGVDGLCGRV